MVLTDSGKPAEQSLTQLPAVMVFVRESKMAKLDKLQQRKLAQMKAAMRELAEARREIAEEQQAEYERKAQMRALSRSFLYGN